MKYFILKFNDGTAALVSINAGTSLADFIPDWHAVQAVYHANADGTVLDRLPLSVGADGRLITAGDTIH